MTQKDRADRYAQGTLVLREGLAVSAGEAIFNQALTNGVVAIGVAEIPSYAALDAAGKRLPAAFATLQALETRFGPSTGGAISIPDRSSSHPWGPTIVAIDILKDAVGATDPVRHGRSAVRALSGADLEALTALDMHRALRVLGTAQIDRYEVRGEAEDIIESGRATAYLKLLDDEEQTRRLETIPVPFAAPGDPLDTEPVECPVCGLDALLSTSADEFGDGVTAGVCFVCSYRRSEFAAHQVNLSLEWERWTDD